MTVVDREVPKDSTIVAPEARSCSRTNTFE